MKKFRVIKKFTLDFLGNEWKEAYLEFGALTVGDVRTRFPALSSMDEKSKTDPLLGLNTILELLKSKFISGKAPNEEGKLVDLQPEDLEALPVEILSKALVFLSPNAVETST